MTEQEITALLDKVKLAAKEAVKSDNEALNATIKSIEESLKGVVSKTEVEALKSEIVRIAGELKAAEEKVKNNPEDSNELKKAVLGMKELLTEIKGLKSDGKGFKTAAEKIQIEVKATQAYGDVGSRDYLGEIEKGITKKPIRRTIVWDLFRKKPVSKEYLHYWEEDAVTRDAKFVIACATSTHGTKVTWIKRTVELAKIRDLVDICIDMLDDYDFVESEIRDLVDTSIMLKADSELLNGTAAAATDLQSINSIASEFNAANTLATYTTSFKTPTIGDLTTAMAAQIYTFGQERAWKADTVLMNYNDMIKYLHAKDANGNYLFPNFVSGATDIVNGMRIVTSPIVAQNKLFVFDSMKGQILIRKTLQISMSEENKDNFEHELLTLKGVMRAQFRVKNIEKDAFMKCSDIAAAITAITKP